MWGIATYIGYSSLRIMSSEIRRLSSRHSSHWRMVSNALRHSVVAFSMSFRGLYKDRENRSAELTCSKKYCTCSFDVAVLVISSEIELSDFCCSPFWLDDCQNGIILLTGPSIVVTHLENLEQLSEYLFAMGERSEAILDVIGSIAFGPFCFLVAASIRFDPSRKMLLMSLKSVVIAPSSAADSPDFAV